MKFTYLSPLTPNECIQRLSTPPFSYEEDGKYLATRILPYQCTNPSDNQVTIVFSGHEYGGLFTYAPWLFTFSECDGGCSIVTEYCGKGFPSINTYSLDLLIKQKINGIREGGESAKRITRIIVTCILAGYAVNLLFFIVLIFILRNAG